MDSIHNSRFGNRSSQSQAHTSASMLGKTPGSKQLIDKSSIVWKDFLTGIKRRKTLINRLREAASDSTASMMILKRQLLEIRELTLTLIEDALEIEYRYHMFDPSSSLAKSTSKITTQTNNLILIKE